MKSSGILLILALVASPVRAQPQTATPADSAVQQPAPAVPRDLNPTQEIAKETPEGPAVVVGPIEFRLGGYLGTTVIFRSTNSGGGTGTSFGSIPYDDTVQGNVSETRLTAQSSRLSLRIDVAPTESQAALTGYFEMDFNGSTSGTVAVTSTSVGFRLRHAFGEAQRRKRHFIAAGQAFSLMTPATNQLSIWPSDYEMSQAVDTNYLAGLVWSRTPQIRFTYRPSATFNWAFSVENPEQQIGSGLVTLPACCAADLEQQYNTGSEELKVPNLMPDLVSRVALNRGRAFHVDAGGVFRVFRHALAPYDAAHTYAHAGGGLGVNARWNPTTLSKLVGQSSYGAGMGRYIGGLVPDVAISPDGEIHPIRTLSWVAGIEQRVAPRLSVAVYDSGVHAENHVFQDAGGGFIGFGYPGASNAANKDIHQATGVFAWQAWKMADRGSMQWNTQLSWVRRTPWSQGTGPASASEFVFFTQFRYNLP